MTDPFDAANEPSHCIRIRGVTVNNLRGIDLDLPRQQVIAICGVSGSGKSSLAVNTLFAEGQRRYIESFSAYSRQFLARLPRPQAREIDGLPPAVAVGQHPWASSGRATLGSVTEVVDYLRVFFAKLASVYCIKCGQVLPMFTPDRVARACIQLPEGTRFVIAYPLTIRSTENLVEAAGHAMREGFVRWIVDDRIERLEQAVDSVPATNEVMVVVDRLMAEPGAEIRIREAAEEAFLRGDGRATLYAEADSTKLVVSQFAQAYPHTLDDHVWQRVDLQTAYRCARCDVAMPIPEPRLFHSGNPWGACPKCHGEETIQDFDEVLAIPEPNKSISEGPVAPWNTPKFREHQQQLLKFAQATDMAMHVPYRVLSAQQKRAIHEGAPEHGFIGIRPFFQMLREQTHDAKMAKFLMQWQRPVVCPHCKGSGLRPEALCYKVNGKHLHDLLTIPVVGLLEFFDEFRPTSEYELAVARAALENAQSRLRYLKFVGLEYLALGRKVNSLSSGELQRVSLTIALGSSLVNMLYVLDEPSSGLHPSDVGRVAAAIKLLRDRGNSVVVVEHDEEILRTADRIVEIGPGAGESGGCVTFEGTPRELETSDALTGEYLSGRRGFGVPAQRRSGARGAIRITQASGKNLRNVDVSFPLGVLCAVCGVSGSGKTALVEDTLYPAICRRKRKKAPPPLPFRDITGDGAVDDVMLVDQSPIGRTPRSNPVTFVKVFDEIRRVFSESMTARLRNLTPGHFSFNVDGGGRCLTCEGDGSLTVDMQFLADVRMTCPDCQGSRYQRDILEVLYRGQSIADVLSMTVRQAFSFFRGQFKIQARLQKLMDIGLEYVRLGQPANTLSAGEAQRLKLATHLAAATRSRILFILDEPTKGLHYQDVVQLLDCLDALLDAGHSLIVVEHNPQVLIAADYLIEMGPGPAEEGGAVLAHGTPEELSERPESPTGRFLRSRVEL
jgi:excinuclease ABC subunit A